MNNMQMMLAMQDDQFQKLLAEDEIINELEKEKYNPTDEYFELMMVLSKVFKICGVTVSCITPAIWAYLYQIKNAYTNNTQQITHLDTDIFLYILHHGIEKIDNDFINKASGFCEKNNINYAQAEVDLKNMIYLSFRPLEMLSMMNNKQAESQQPRFNVDWLTRLISTVAPATNLTSNDIIYNMSLTQCFYYFIQSARKNDIYNQIRRRDSDEINEAIFKRTMQLGKVYYDKNYKDK